MQLIVTQEDINQIQDVIEEFLNEFHPDLDFSVGSPLHDILVEGIKIPVTLVQSIAEKHRQTRSLSGIERLLDALAEADLSDPDVQTEIADIDAAVDEILSNWFIERSTGTRSKGVITLHLSNNLPFTIPADWRSYRTVDLPFLPFGGEATLVSESDLVAQIDSDGNIFEYTYRLMVEAETQGNIGDTDEGDWENWEDITPFLIRISSSFRFSGGADPATSQELINQARDGGIVERSLHNSRSLNARFSEEFPASTPLSVIGAGDAEMQRDLIVLGGSIPIHVLNHMNIYISGDIIESQFTQLELASDYTHPRLLEFFSGEFNRALLPNVPILHIREIAYEDDGSIPAITALADPDGFVRFDLISRQRLNSLTNEPEDNPYSLLNQAKIIPLDVESPYYTSSLQQSLFLEINPAAALPSEIINLTYDTLADIEIIDEFVRNSEERVVCANPLVYSYYPVVLSFDLEYIRDPLRAQVDRTDAIRTLTETIRAYDRGTPLFSSVIAKEFLLDNEDLLYGVKPITLNYSLILPDGNIMEFESTDRLSMDISYLKAGSYRPVDSDGNFVELSTLQISDKTIFVFTDETLINVTEATS